MNAKNYALWLLGRRAYSEKRLRDKLRFKKYDATDIEPVVKFCLDYKFLDDLEYAKSFIRTRLALRPRGARVLTLELRKRGIAQDNIEMALADNEALGDETELIRRLVGQKKKQYAGLGARVARQRLFGFLARRGFSLSKIKEVLDEDAQN
jgi:regulatory protein